MTNVTWFKEASKKDIDTIGIKASVLVDLYRNKLPIPSGFIINSNTFKKFIIENNISETITSLLNSTNTDDKEKLSETLIKIKELILDSDFPQYLKRDIIEAYESLNVDISIFKTASKEALDIIKAGRDSPYVIVKPSLNINNLDSESKNTFINIRGYENLINAVKKCWSNLFSIENIPYLNTLTFSVIVQKMINAEKSGLVYTENTNGNKNEILIDSCIGITEPTQSIYDEYIIDKPSFEIIFKKTNTQEFAFLKDNFGRIGKKNLFESEGSRQKLDDLEIKRISRLAKQLEDLYQEPQKIEFAVEGSKIYLLKTEALTIKNQNINQDMIQNIEKQEAVKEEPKNEAVKETAELEELESITQIKASLNSIQDIYSPEINKVDGIGLLKSEDIFKDFGEYSNLRKIEFMNKLANELKTICRIIPKKTIWYKTSSIDNLEFFKTEVESIRNLHDDGFTNIGIMLPKITSISQIKKAKEIAKTLGLEACEELEFGIMIDTPASVHLIKDICEEEIDFISLCTDSLTKLTLGDDNSDLTNLHDSVSMQIKKVIEICKENNVETSACGNACNNDKVIELLVKYGIDNISVNLINIDRAKRIIALTEKRLLLDIARKNI